MNKRPATTAHDDTGLARAARNAVGSVRAEGLEPSEELHEDLDQAVAGHLTPEAVLARAVERARRTRTRT